LIVAFFYCDRNKLYLVEISSIFFEKASVLQFSDRLEILIDDVHFRWRLVHS